MARCVQAGRKTAPSASNQRKDQNGGVVCARYLNKRDILLSFVVYVLEALATLCIRRVRAQR